MAERLGRVPFGVELIEEKVSFARSKLVHPEGLLQGDARNLASLGLPPIDFSMTSPPYMNKGDREDPFTAYRDTQRLCGLPAGNAQHLRATAQDHETRRQRVVIEIANLKLDGQVTTVAWDVAGEVSKVLHFQGEVVVCWDQAAYGSDHSYCLVYSVL